MRQCRIPNRLRLVRRVMYRRRWELFKKSIDALSRWSFYMADGELKEIHVTRNHGCVFLSVDNTNAVEIKTCINKDEQ